MADDAVAMLVAMWRRRRPARGPARPRPGPPSERWAALMPPRGPAGRCLFCRELGAACACACVCGARRAACRCDEFLPPAAARAFRDGDAAGRLRRFRTYMRKCLGGDAAARRMLCAHVLSRPAGARCVICGWTTACGHSGLCNACRNQNFVKRQLREARAARRE